MSNCRRNLSVIMLVYSTKSWSPDGRPLGGTSRYAVDWHCCRHPEIIFVTSVVPSNGYVSMVQVHQLDPHKVQTVRELKDKPNSAKASIACSRVWQEHSSSR